MDNRPDRPLLPALLNGLRWRCPACGEGPLYDGFLKVRETCPHCGQRLDCHRADDAPAWATMLVVGHVMIPVIVVARTYEDFPVWAHMTLWPLLTLALCLLLLPSVKGMVIAVQWALGMHGFERPES